MVVWLMNDELEKILEETAAVLSRCNPGICLKGPNEFHENPSHDSQYTDRDPTRKPPEYESKALALR
jgi:Zn-finger nucleic acid-binding protein